MTPTNDVLAKIKEKVDLLKKINHENVIQYLDFFVNLLYFENFFQSTRGFEFNVYVNRY